MARSDTLKKNGHEEVHLENVSPTPPDRQPNRSSWTDTSPTNPQNWPVWKKNAQILMVAFHSMAATFMAAGIIPAYDIMAERYNVTVPQASYLTSVQVRDIFTSSSLDRVNFFPFYVERIARLTSIIHTDLAFRNLSPFLETYYLYLRTIPCFPVFGPWKYGLQYRRSTLYNLRDTNGHSSAHCSPHFSSYWDRQRCDHGAV